MKFDLSEDQTLLIDSARQFFGREHSFAERKERAKRGDSFSAAKWRGFAEMGWLGIASSESAGGLGLSMVEVTLLAEELGRAQALEPYAACAVLPACLLERLAGARSASLLTVLISGEAVVAAALGEPQARGVIADVALCADRMAGGWRLDGLKSLVVGAPQAQWLLVSARTSGERNQTAGISVFLVPREQAGITVEGDRLVDWSSAADVRFKDVFVSQEALLGAEGEAFEALQEAVDSTILALCAEAVGAMEGAIKVTAPYLAERKQFGVPIATFQALQHRMADMAIELMQARSAVYGALATFFRPDATARSIAVSGCKAMVTRIGKWTTSQGIQLHGGYGITEEYQVGHYFKRLLVIDALFGRMDHHLNRYADMLVANALRATS